MKRLGFLSLFPVIMWVLSSCASTGENPATRPTPGFAEVALQPATSVTLPPPSPLLKALQISEELDLEEIRLAVKDLDLKFSGDLDTDFVGPFVIRLIRQGAEVDEALPPFGTTQVPVGSYAQLDLSLDKLPLDQIPPEATDDPVIMQFLPDNSLVVEGTFLESPNNDIDQSGTVSRIFFRFLSDNGNNLRIVTPTPFSLKTGLNFLFIAFKVSLWFNAPVVQALQDLSPDTFQNGVILLSDQSSNDQIRHIVDLIEENVDQSLRFAPSEDNTFQESDVDQGSSSSVF
jgi:hypothetical protein